MSSINHIIISPVITEKAYAQQENGYYTFWVTRSSNKNQISMAFKTLYSHDPLSVNIVSVKGKVKTDWKRRTPNARPDRKKAIVFIGKDKKIESLKLNTK